MSIRVFLNSVFVIQVVASACVGVKPRIGKVSRRYGEVRIKGK